MSQQKPNFIGSTFIDPLIENTEPEFVTVIAILTPSGVDEDVLSVTFPSNEEFEFQPDDDGLPEDFYEPGYILYNIVKNDWKSDPDVPHLIRYFLLQHKEFVDNIENVDNLNWILEIDTETYPGETMTNFYPVEMDEISETYPVIEQNI